ncbi:B12-binding domain-containing radical SAM protein [Mycoplasmatota bacterium zrk1]
MNLLFISFDFHKENKPETSFAVAKLFSVIKNEFPSCNLTHFSFNMYEEYFMQKEALNALLNQEFDYIAVSLYSWCMPYISNLVAYIKSQSKAKLIAGGYEVNKKNIDYLLNNYPDFTNFIIGYAEKPIVDILKGSSNKQVYNDQQCYDSSIYSNNTIFFDKDMHVSLETKRGCLFKCSFCSYNNNENKGVKALDTSIIFKELDSLNNTVTKVNIIDPMFFTENYMEVIDYLISIEFTPEISVQAKFENFYLILDNNLIDKLKSLNITIEFGLQSINHSSHNSVNRHFNYEKTMYILGILNKENINYRISVIRGLPYETLESYIELTKFLRENTNKKIDFFPLSLLKNTKLYDERNYYNFKTQKINNIDHAISSNSYTYQDYLIMQKIEKELIA